MKGLTKECLSSSLCFTLLLNPEQWFLLQNSYQAWGPHLFQDTLIVNVSWVSVQEVT